MFNFKLPYSLEVTQNMELILGNSVIVAQIIYKGYSLGKGFRTLMNSVVTPNKVAKTLLGAGEIGYRGPFYWAPS